MIDLETQIENLIWNEIQKGIFCEFEQRYWLEEHCPERWHQAADGQIQFEDEQDQIIFLLRWGHDYNS